MWLLALVVDVILAVELLMGFSAIPLWLIFVVVIAVTLVLLFWVGRIRVTVTGEEFQVDDARLPVAVISDVIALDQRGRLEVLGVGAHPLAFVIQRPWIGPAVQVLLDDPADPTPYWVVSTREPVKLATALLAARDAAVAARA
jgi:hypothetical protein